MFLRKLLQLKEVKVFDYQGICLNFILSFRRLDNALKEFQSLGRLGRRF
jgi:hypothetical protein